MKATASLLAETPEAHSSDPKSLRVSAGSSALRVHATHREARMAGMLGARRIQRKFGALGYGSIELDVLELKAHHGQRVLYLKGANVHGAKRTSLFLATELATCDCCACTIDSHVKLLSVSLKQSFCDMNKNIRSASAPKAGHVLFSTPP